MLVQCWHILKESELNLSSLRTQRKQTAVHVHEFKNTHTPSHRCTHTNVHRNTCLRAQSAFLMHNVNIKIPSLISCLHKPFISIMFAWGFIFEKHLRFALWLANALKGAQVNMRPCVYFLLIRTWNVVPRTINNFSHPQHRAHSED